MQLLVDEQVSCLEAFQRFGSIYPRPAHFHALADKELKPIQGLIIRSKTLVNEALLQRLPYLQFVGSCVAGTDHLDLAALQARNIHLATASGCNANAVAEYVIIALLNQPYQHQCLGIVGFGKVGQSIAHKALQLGLRLLIYDPPQFSNLQDANCVAKRWQVVKHLQQLTHASVISLNASLNSHAGYENAGMIDAAFMAQLTPQQLLINVARGELVDEQALIATCRQQHAPQLIWDCWQQEPYINNALMQHCKIATPHIAGHSHLAKVAGSQRILQSLEAFCTASISIKPKRGQQRAQAMLQSLSQIKDLQLTEAQIATFRRQALSIYNPAQDDLRSIGKSKSLSVAQHFQQHRQHYPLRYEWHEQAQVFAQDKDFMPLIQPLWS